MSEHNPSASIRKAFHLDGKLPRLAISLGCIAIIMTGLIATFCRQTPTGSKQARTAGQAPLVDPMILVLAPQTGDGKTDQEISRRQGEIRGGKNPEIALEQLGWAFVAKARESFDAGFYKLAEQCALVLEQRQPQHHGALLLRGHALHNLHQFKEAESIARQLVAQRGSPLDFGLLGDALMERGRLEEAIAAYQEMTDLKPDAHAHTRIAHVRWLKGDVIGAIEAMQVAAAAASPLAPEFSAWVFTRLAGFQWQAGALAEAQRSCDVALDYQHDYAPALLLRGRMWLADGKNSEAVEVLARAAALNPLPEYQWALADALSEAGRVKEAQAVEENLRRHGAAEDPRSFALFLTTRGETNEIALRLAQSELDSRRDVMTYDALAWALAGMGRISEAQSEMERALSEGTEDARLFFHAAVIASRNGRSTEARQWFEKTSRIAHMLLPSERKRFQTALAEIAQRTPVAASATAPSLSTRVN
jgi:tetratricopeptide (TPR) repeat protein